MAEASLLALPRPQNGRCQPATPATGRFFQSRGGEHPETVASLPFSLDVSRNTVLVLRSVRTRPSTETRPDMRSQSYSQINSEQIVPREILIILPRSLEKLYQAIDAVPGQSCSDTRCAPERKPQFLMAEARPGPFRPLARCCSRQGPDSGVANWRAEPSHGSNKRIDVTCRWGLAFQGRGSESAPS